MNRRPLCPVCYQVADKTVKGNIGSHYDSLRLDICPATGYPYRIAVKRPLRLRGAA